MTPQVAKELAGIGFSKQKRHAVVLTIAMLLALGAFTPAALAGTVSFDGPALVFTAGDNLDHELQFRGSYPGYDEIYDSYPITDFPEPECALFSGEDDHLLCDGRNAVRVELGGGRDDVTFNSGSSYLEDCFNSYILNLGDGVNSNLMGSTCGGPATLTITSGSGNDTLAGGAAGTTATIFAGGGRDSVDGGDGDDIIHGGEGDDGVFGELGNDQVFGEGGNDQLRGGDGNDVEDGGPGDDDIGYRGVNVISEPDPGADQVRGGDGVDLLRLDGHVGGMAISLDGQANDGTPGEGDNVGSDFEEIRSGTGNDVFAGSPGGDVFDGGSGDDQIHGGDGGDALQGGGGNDSVFGDAGNDRVEGMIGTDAVDGGPGTDEIYGDIAGCSVFCEPDVDSLFARDGERDLVNCGGPGYAQVDDLDVVGRCATVDRQKVDGNGATGKAGCAKAKRKLAKHKKKLKKLKANAAKAKAISKQKKKVKKAKKAKRKACA